MDDYGLDLATSTTAAAPSKKELTEDEELDLLSRLMKYYLFHS
jgi:hypothetical protein